MLRSERRWSTRELVEQLGRSRTTIQWTARRYRIGRRGANRQFLFTQAEIEALQERLSAQRGRPRSPHPDAS